jgi:hypothetical protein
MKRAAELFHLDEWPSPSRFVARTWRARSVPEPAFLSVAASHWEMVVTTQGGVRRLTIRGPETRATVVAIPQDAEFFGIEFSMGTFMPGLPPRHLVDRHVDLPATTSRAAWFQGTALELPTPDTADVFVERLVRGGTLVHDVVAAAAVRGVVDGYSRRTLERRVARATGLSRGTIRQIGRAHRAVDALRAGTVPAEAARHAAYADQAHLTRSLKRFVGQTPAQIVAAAGRG